MIKRGDEMVEISIIQVNRIELMCIKIKLPHITSHVIYSTKVILLDEYWSIEAIDKKGEAAVCQSRGRTPESLLENQLIAVSKIAFKKGIDLSLSGRDAILKIHEN